MHGIGISSVTFDIIGAMYFSGHKLDTKETQKNQQRERRGSRVATLDGGCVVYDTGYSAADRDLIVKVVEATDDVVAFMIYMTETYSQIKVSTNESTFLATPKRFYVDDDNSAVMILEVIQDIGG
jgi:hypothetical protein